MAAAATPGPWRCHAGVWPLPGGSGLAVLPADHADYRGPLVIAPTMSVDPDMAARNALANSQWMALVSPAIAEPLAAMLEDWAIKYASAEAVETLTLTPMELRSEERPVGEE